MKINVKSATSWPALQVVDAVPCGVPGLAINADHGTPATWVITHIRSGLAVAYFPAVSPEAVLAAAQALGTLADWTMSAEDVADHITLGDVLDTVKPWGGEWHRVITPGDRAADVPAVTS